MSDKKELEMPNSPFTPEMLKEAIKTAHDDCKNGCIHAKSFDEANDFMRKRIQQLMLAALTSGDPNPVEFVYYNAFHDGYNTHKMMTEPVAKEKVN